MCIRSLGWRATLVLALVVFGWSATAGEKHWAFEPVERPLVPEVRDGSKVRTDVDRFVQAKLGKEGLSIGPEADRTTLLRRLSFDLTGLPPTPGDVATFLSDPAPDAYERMLERYLDSPRYGERWGKYWLDTAGYADSNGYFHADTDRPLAYRYRDHVIRSFNEDKPYDRFLREQIAGDELSGYNHGGDVNPDMTDMLVATHFLRNSQDGSGESDGNPLERRIDKLKVVEGTVEILGSVVLGLTLQCARCHDHKFEPVTQVEYYGLQAIFAAYSPERWLKPNERTVAIGSRAQRGEHERRTRQVEEQIAALKRSLAEFAAPLSKQVVDERAASLEEPLRTRLRAALEKAEKDRSEDDKALLEKHESLVKVADENLVKRFPEYAAFRKSTGNAIAEREKERPPPLEKISCYFESHRDPLPHRLLVRGEYTRPGKEVEPGVPAALSKVGNRFEVRPLAEGRTSSGRRTALARWLTSPQNPLVSRVMVNRIWQRHFGVGLVATATNLGCSGSEPTHQELLDYLAFELVQSGWSVKAMQRLILSSAVFRQSSAWREDGGRVDPENRLLWRFSMRRLDADSLRDAMLLVSGELDRRMFGPYVPTTRRGDGQVVVEGKRDGSLRRSVYLQQRRTQVLTLLEVFDAPMISVNCVRRASSTIPLQSLALLNSEFAHARAAAFARRLEREAGPGARERISRAFLLALGRGPDASERATAERFLGSQPTEYPDAADRAGRAWVDFCQMLLASNAFLYVE